MRHSFHIPVMGTAFTIDTPLKVAHYGIDSVIALADDILMERMRKMYCEKYNLAYEEIKESTLDYRAKRITAYLNLMQDLVNKNFHELCSNIGVNNKEFQLLPESKRLKTTFCHIKEGHGIEVARKWLKDQIQTGSIDVNIMTKVDKVNYYQKEKLPQEYNDAHAALRGFANSQLASSVVFSAGMNPRLYDYITHFEDFYPDKDGFIKKKIIIKVSDFRSAMIQGKFLAKKGIWVSEYRIESGLNCGGHAFATEGLLMGPILAEFRDRREELIASTFEVFSQALEQQEKTPPSTPPPLIVSAQGGVGTAEEHDFLLGHYQLDSIGWGTPFLLVPEATTVDEHTLTQLVAAKEEDLYLSNISPLGVPFNNLKGNTQDEEKDIYINKNRPGSACPKKCLALNTEFSDKGMCTASRQYQHLKLASLEKEGLSKSQLENEIKKVVEKACLCVGLGNAALIKHQINRKKENTGVSICPGPNLAYFSNIMSLTDISNHIYGFSNMISRTDRPHMFVKELSLYMDFLSDKIKEAQSSMSKKQEKYLIKFSQNLDEGIRYYKKVFEDSKNKWSTLASSSLDQLNHSEKKLSEWAEHIQQMMSPKVTT